VPAAAHRAGGQTILPNLCKGDIFFVSAEHRYPPAGPPGDGAVPPDPGINWWADTINRINTWWVERPPAGPAVRDWARATPRRVVATAAALTAAIVVAAVTAVLWLASAVYGLLAAAAADGRHTGAEARWSAAGRLTRVITDPVHAYLTGHAAALHTNGRLLWLGWLATTAILFALAVLGSTGARIGWTLTGALTTTVVYTSTPTDARLLAAGVAVTAWSLLSIAAFNRTAVTRPDPDITIITHPAPTGTADYGDHRTDTAGG
jgi:hypothetical protein